jgi:murein DD-endopeptidase MepM/ murein hydrolase activator NlpD
MKNEFYALIILDGTGRTVGRRRIARKAIRNVLVIAGAIFALFIACTIHALIARPTAKASHTIAQENAEMRELAKRLEADLPELRRIALGAGVEFDQIWAKSGLGLEARGLAVGPFESQGANNPDTGTSVILQMDPIELPIEIERVLGDGKTAQRDLGELLEYFHDAQKMLSNTPSVRPAHSHAITSTFGRREDPVHGGLALHKGLDIGGSTGTEIFAPADGTIIFVGKRGGYGNVIVVDHGYGLQTHYAHLSKFRTRVGDHVKRGDTLADMGSTGKSTGPHLHYEVRRYGRPLDPARFILD